MKNIEKNSAWFLLTSLLAIGCFLFWIYCLYQGVNFVIFHFYVWGLFIILILMVNTRIFVATRSKLFLYSGAILILWLIELMFLQWLFAPGSLPIDRELFVPIIVIILNYFAFIIFLMICSKIKIFPNHSSLNLLSSSSACNEDEKYSGEEISISCPEIASLSNLDFCNKMQEFCEE